jgi:hypothetical protein
MHNARCAGRLADCPSRLAVRAVCRRRQPAAHRSVISYVAAAWLIFLAFIGLAVLAGTLVGLLLDSAFGVTLV